MFDLLEESRYVIRTDPHCHILPGVDDGSQNESMSLAMARKALSLGVERMVATPHACHPSSCDGLTAKDVRRRVEKLNSLFAEHQLQLSVFPGMELLINEELAEKYEAGELLTWADQGKYVLLELGFNFIHPAMWSILDFFESKGLSVMVAHPERYVWLPDNMGVLQRLVERGYFFQLNVMSLNGLWGPGPQNLALQIMRRTPQWIVGTDSHNDAERFWGIAQVREFLEHQGVWRGQGQPHEAPLAAPKATD